MPRTWSTSGRSANWPAIRKRIVERDQVCQWTEDGIKCGRPGRIVDHIRPKFEGGSDVDENLQLLCQHHSDIKTQAEGLRAWKAKCEAQRKRMDRSRPHPGLIT